MKLLQLDPDSVVLLFVVSAFFMALLIYFTFRGRQTSVSKLWALSLFFQGVGWGLVYIRASLPAWAAVSPAAFCISLNQALLLMAICHFYRIKTPYYWPFFPVGLIAIVAIAAPSTALVQGLDHFIVGVIQMATSCIVILTRKDRWGALRLIIGGTGLISVLLILIRLFEKGMGHDASAAFMANDQYISLMLLVAFVVRMAYFFGFMMLIEAHRYDAMNELATRDALTGVYNRRTLFELAHRELARQQRSTGSLALLLIDIDHFKRINDTYGHQTGDVVLSQIAKTIAGALRLTDILGRYGGEEFCIIAPDTSSEAVLVLAERIRQQVSIMEIQSLGGIKLEVTCSIGIACLAASNKLELTENLDALIAQADTALYKAKKTGRNRIIQ